ncbi:MAG: hypothetical protein ACKO0Z_08605 [Betaproteobacteria bacterium]
MEVKSGISIFAESLRTATPVAVAELQAEFEAVYGQRWHLVIAKAKEINLRHNAKLSAWRKRPAAKLAKLNEEHEL